jgi:eukaryotic-like serine/threonine-protein kinase
VTSITNSRLEEVVDRFELHWNDLSLEQIPHLLAQVGLEGNAVAAGELLRVDIQRRYAANLPVDLDSYWSMVPEDGNRNEVIREIAFEDYRTRKSHALSLRPERWADSLGVEKESWFLELCGNGTGDITTHFLKNSTDSIGSKIPPSGNSSVESVMDSLGFKPVKQIGRGAFSCVYLARQESLASRYVVVKAVQRTFGEAQRLAELQHTNIVPIYSFHRRDPWSFLCMPYAGLLTLSDYFDAIPDSNLRSGQSFVSTIQGCRDDTWKKEIDVDADPQASHFEDTERGSLNVSESLSPLHRDALALWLFSRVVDALHHAHARGILHGDIKPANLLIRNDGEPALLDFNLSQRFDRSEASVIGGTLAYMSPESMRSLMGADSPVSIESDIYSLGVVIYQFLTGRLVYSSPRSAAPADLEVAIGQRQNLVGWEDSDQTSPALRSIVEKCLAFSPGQRYASADQLREDLECERWNLPLKHARDHSLRHRARKWISRHPRATSVGPVAAVAATIICLMSAIGWRVAESRDKLVASRTFQLFEADARMASAELLSVGVTQQTDEIQKAVQCLATYQLLENDKWTENKQWRLLAEREQQIALALMTNLLLKISWKGMENGIHVEAESNSGKTLEHDFSLRARRVLAEEPFASQAPLAIEHLSRAANSPTDDVSSPSEFNLDYSQTINLTPLDQVGLATQYVELGMGEDALELLPASLLRQVDAYTYWITLGRAQMSMLNHPSAELSFSLAIENLPQAAAAFHYRGLCRMEMTRKTDKRKAVMDLSEALRKQPDSLDSIRNRALVLEALDELDAATEDLKTLIERDPQDAQALVMLSRVFRKQNKLVESKQTLDAALSCQPRTVSGWIARALARLPTDKNGALRDLLDAQRIAPTSTDVLQNLAHVYSEHLNEPEKAIASLDRLLDVSPGFELALLGRAVLHARKGNRNAALRDLKTAMDAKGDLKASSFYQAACVFSLLLTHSNDERDVVDLKNDAFMYLSAALQRGYGSDILESDPDLVSVRDDDRFYAAVATVRSGRNLLNPRN